MGAKLAGLLFPNSGEVTNLVGNHVSKATNVLGKIKGEYDGLQDLSDEQAVKDLFGEEKGENLSLLFFEDGDSGSKFDT